MRRGFKIRMALNAVRQSDPEDVIALVDAVLPAVVDVLPKPMLRAFIKGLFKNHLGLLLRDFDQGERAEILTEVLPYISKEFPLGEVDVTEVEETEA